MQDPQTPVVVVTMVSISNPADVDALRGHLMVLSGNPGCWGIELGRSLDSDAEFTVVSRWDNVGSYRKALSNFRVKAEVVPFLSVRTTASFTGEIIDRMEYADSETFVSGRAANADTYERGQR